MGQILAYEVDMKMLALAPKTFFHHLESQTRVVFAKCYAWPRAVECAFMGLCVVFCALHLVIGLQGRA